MSSSSKLKSRFSLGMRGIRRVVFPAPPRPVCVGFGGAGRVLGWDDEVGIVDGGGLRVVRGPR